VINVLKQSVNKVQKKILILFAVLLVLSVVATVSAAANFPDNDKHGNGHCDHGTVNIVTGTVIRGVTVIKGLVAMDMECQLCYQSNS